MTARARTLAVLAAYVCLVAQGAGVMHAIFVRHATCPTHGELTHATRVADRRAAPAPGPAASGTAVGLEDVDEHCLAAGMRRDAAALQPVVAVARVAPGLPAPLVVAPLVLRPVPLLGVAPKTSPPSA
jgi:hypothetical protein